MQYSYIKPKKKSALTKDFQLLVLFFSISFAMIFGFYTFLAFMQNSLNSQRQDSIKESQLLTKNIQDTKENIAIAKKQLALSQQMQTKNIILKDSIKNLFDLVPDTITLTQAKIESNALILYGSTPSKDIYNFMLQAPLRSIFHKTYTSFYPTQNGWYNFVSTNYLLEDELDE